MDETKAAPTGPEGSSPDHEIAVLRAALHALVRDTLAGQPVPDHVIHDEQAVVDYYITQARGREDPGDAMGESMHEDRAMLTAEIEELRIALAEALAIIESECAEPSGSMPDGEVGRVYAAGVRLLDKEP